MPTMTAREVRDEEIRKRAWDRAADVEAADPELAHALRCLARDIGTEDERPGSVALLDEEPYVPTPRFGVAVMMGTPGGWKGSGEAQRRQQR